MAAKKIKVLVIDDSALVRQILVEMNHLTKNLSWKSRLGFYQVKNGLEPCIARAVA